MTRSPPPGSRSTPGSTSPPSWTAVSPSPSPRVLNPPAPRGPRAPIRTGGPEGRGERRSVRACGVASASPSGSRTICTARAWPSGRWRRCASTRPVLRCAPQPPRSARVSAPPSSRWPPTRSAVCPCGSRRLTPTRATPVRRRPAARPGWPRGRCWRRAPGSWNSSPWSSAVATPSIRRRWHWPTGACGRRWPVALAGGGAGRRGGRVRRPLRGAPDPPRRPHHRSRRRPRVMDGRGPPRRGRPRHRAGPGPSRAGGHRAGRRPGRQPA